MNHKATLFGIFSATISSAGIWLVLLFNVDPIKGDVLTHLAFLASLFLWLSGLITLIEYKIRTTISKEVIFAPLAIAARHGMQVGFIVITLLGLQLLRVLNLFDAILITAIILTSELYFKARINHA